MRDILLKYPNFPWKRSIPLDTYLDSVRRDFEAFSQADEFKSQVSKSKLDQSLFMVDLAGGAIESKQAIKTQSVTTTSEPGGVMEFSGVMTQFDGNSEDLDGDIVEPLGGSIAKNAPLLLFHCWDLPIGRNVAVTEQTANVVRVKNIIADTQLGNDAAALIEVGGLRMSHGFESLECHAIEKADARGHLVCTGVRFKKWITREVTLTPMPANENAIVEAWSRKSIKSPQLGLIAQGLDKIRTKSISVALTSDAKANLEGIFEMSAARIADAIEQKLKSLGISMKKEGDAQGDGSKKPGDNGDDDTKKPDDDAKKADEEKKPDDDKKSGNTTLTDMIASLQELANGDIPETAKSRLGTVLSIATEVQGMMSENAEKISQAAESEDVAGMFAGVADVIADIVGKLSDACDEIEKILGMEGVADSAGGSLRGAHESCKAIMEAIGGILEAAEDLESEDKPKEGDEGADGKSGDAAADRDFASMTASATRLAGHLIAGGKISDESKSLLALAVNS